LLNNGKNEGEKVDMSVKMADQTLDIRDYLNPLSILKVQSVLNKMRDGQILEVWSNDVETKVVLVQIVDNSNNELVTIEKQGEYEKIYIKRCRLG
jgi:TusA-related sulfurtransferase